MAAQSVQLSQHDVLDAFESAAASARIAAEEFADAAAKYGRDVALKRFNDQVSFWANRFTNVRYRRYAYTVASCMDGETHTFRVSQAALMAKYRERHPGKKIGHTTIQQYNKAMAAAGIFDVIHHRQDSESEHPGAYETTEYHVHFGRVLVGDQVMPHDFTQVSLGAKSAETDTSHSRTKTSNGGGDGGTDSGGDGGTDALFSHSSLTSSPTSSSSRRADEAAPMGDNRAKASTRPQEPSRDEDDSSAFFSWLAEAIAVPQTAINQKVILARMVEVEQDFPGLDWSILREYSGWDWYWSRPIRSRVGAFHNHLAEIVQEIFAARKAKEYAAQAAERAERELAERARAREAARKAKEEADRADKVRLAEIVLEMTALLDEYVTAFISIRPRLDESNSARVRFQARRDIETAKDAHNAGLRLSLMKREIEHYHINMQRRANQ